VCSFQAANILVDHCLLNGTKVELFDGTLIAAENVPLLQADGKSPMQLRSPSGLPATVEAVEQREADEVWRISAGEALAYSVTKEHRLTLLCAFSPTYALHALPDGGWSMSLCYIDRHGRVAHRRMCVRLRGTRHEVFEAEADAAEESDEAQTQLFDEDEELQLLQSPFDSSDAEDTSFAWSGSACPVSAEQAVSFFKSHLVSQRRFLVKSEPVDITVEGLMDKWEQLRMGRDEARLRAFVMPELPAVACSMPQPMVESSKQAHIMYVLPAEAASGFAQRHLVYVHQQLGLQMPGDAAVYAGTDVLAIESIERVLAHATEDILVCGKQSCDAWRQYVLEALADGRFIPDETSCFSWQQGVCRLRVRVLGSWSTLTVWFAPHPGAWSLTAALSSAVGLAHRLPEESIQRARRSRLSELLGLHLSTPERTGKEDRLGADKGLPFRVTNISIAAARDEDKRFVIEGGTVTHNSGVTKLSDFGVAAQLSSSVSKRKTVSGSPYWMAPEVLTASMGSNEKADIWSLGATAIELATGDPPYHDIMPLKAIFAIPQMPPPRLPATAPDGTPHTWSAAFNDFVAVCLQKDPEKRPSARRLLDSHPFLKRAAGPELIKQLVADCMPEIDKYREIEARMANKIAFGGTRGASLGGDYSDSEYSVSQSQHSISRSWHDGVGGAHMRATQSISDMRQLTSGSLNRTQTMGATAGSQIAYASMLASRWERELSRSERDRDRQRREREWDIELSQRGRGGAGVDDSQRSRSPSSRSHSGAGAGGSIAAILLGSPIGTGASSPNGNLLGVPGAASRSPLPSYPASNMVRSASDKSVAALVAASAAPAAATAMKTAMARSRGSITAASSGASSGAASVGAEDMAALQQPVRTPDAESNRSPPSIERSISQSTSQSGLWPRHHANLSAASSPVPPVGGHGAASSPNWLDGSGGTRRLHRHYSSHLDEYEGAEAESSILRGADADDAAADVQPEEGSADASEVEALESHMAAMAASNAPIVGDDGTSPSFMSLYRTVALQAPVLSEEEERHGLAHFYEPPVAAAAQELQRLPQVRESSTSHAHSRSRSSGQSSSSTSGNGPPPTVTIPPASAAGVSLMPPSGSRTPSAHSSCAPSMSDTAQRHSQAVPSSPFSSVSCLGRASPSPVVSQAGSTAGSPSRTFGGGSGSYFGFVHAAASSVPVVPPMDLSTVGMLGPGQRVTTPSSAARPPSVSATVGGVAPLLSASPSPSAAAVASSEVSPPRLHGAPQTPQPPQTAATGATVQTAL